MKLRFGLHIRLHQSLFDAVEKVERLEHRFFQTVLMLQSRQFLNLTESEIEKFIKFRRQHCDQLFVHAAYWSNVTDKDSRGFYSLRKEIELAEKLEFTHIVIHPGSFAKHFDEGDRIEIIADAINLLLQESSSIILLLENSPHKDRSFSPSIQEFGKLLKKIKNQQRVKMCIDTAHAYVAGYDISNPKKVEEFVAMMAHHIGIENIGLLHCNDTKNKKGSFLDEHAIPGYGNIGMEALYHFVHHPKLLHVPVIFEMPSLDESLELDIIQQFNDMEILRS